MDTPIKYQVVVYPSEDDEGGRFTAHCLNMDIIADDDTVEGAVSKLLETIEATMEAAQKHNADPFSSAPREYWDKLANADRLPQELVDRIMLNARKSERTGRYVDIESQCELRQLEPA